MRNDSANLSPTSTAQAKPPVRVGDLLVERGLVTPEQVEQALAYQREKGHTRLLGEVLVEMQFVTIEQVLSVVAAAYDVPFAHITPRMADPCTAQLLSRDLLEEHCIAPLFHIQRKLTVAVTEPSDVFLIEEIERQAGMPVQIVVSPADDIKEVQRHILPDSTAFIIDDLVENIHEDDFTIVEQQVTDLADIEGAVGDSPVIKLVNYLIFTAVRDSASDIHIEPDEGRLRVRLRVDGRLFEAMSPPHNMLPAIVSRIKIMANLDISERRVPQDGAITVMINKRPIDLRVSTMPGKFGEKVVMRVIDNSGASLALEKIGFSSETLSRWRSVIEQPNGVVLVTGPTGSGKSTTLYGSLAEINHDSVNISTVEDPVEYNMPGVNQFQVNDKAGFTFAGALRSLLRQDPDIVMVGEIRDQETARIATQAALTGHLVLSTLHTNDAPSAITRLFNIGVEPYLVAASIRGVLAQRLLRKICPSCKEAAEPTITEQAVLSKLSAAADQPVEVIFKGAGCPKCRDTGYQGRIGVYELFVPDDESLDAISRGAALGEMRRLAKAAGMTALSEDGLAKVINGVTTLEELYAITAT